MKLRLTSLVLVIGCMMAVGHHAIAAPAVAPAVEIQNPTAHAATAPAQSTFPAAADLFNELIAKIDARFNDPLFSHAHWGVVIQSLDTGKVWYERNPERLFMPASNQKIFTTAATLLTLGPEFRFTTLLLHTGTIEGSTLRGDLIVYGNGDPTLYERFYKDTREVFRGWASQLKDKGITQITGNVIGDDNAWDDEHIGNGWPLDGLDAWYSAPYGPLNLNENYIDFRIIPPKTPEGSVEIVPNCPSSYFTIVNQVEVVASGNSSVSASRAYGTNEFVFRGKVVAGSRTLEESPSIWNPTFFYVTVLKEVLEEEGIEVDGEAIDCDDLKEWNADRNALPKLIVHESPPLSEILTMLMKRSQNLFAEVMVHTLGWKSTGKGTFRDGRNQLQTTLEPLGVKPGEYAFSDGSGLTRYNFVSPRQITNILVGMQKSQYWTVWRDMLPIAGVDGTLRNRMKNTPAERNVRAKTGTISNVRGLSGYVTTADGEQVVFSFLVNAHLRSSLQTEMITDDVLAMIAGFTRTPAPAATSTQTP